MLEAIWCPSQYFGLGDLAVSCEVSEKGGRNIPVAGIWYGNEKNTIAKISHKTVMILTVIPTR